ncbi:MinD/ParA family protein [Sphingobium sp. SA916]|uniref:MinD/ParA family protein n=1 Tax=Sphingobium sp. SA916 TaxID=1851207 RepID=UPI0011AFAD19|nr:MinD/ParA family protein [Sphingobium sp. SA916]
MAMIIDQNAASCREPHAVEGPSVIFVTGDKGGVGKSFKALNFIRLSRTSLPQAPSPKWR